jgi:outer membrane biosynthesis protein TonB
VIHRDIETKVVSIQGETLDCGMFQTWIEPAGYPPMPKEAYCISRDTHNLSLSQTKYFSIRYRDFAPFLDQSIPWTITASKGSQTRCRIKIQQLDQAALDDAAMTPPSDASPTSPAPNIWATHSGETTPTNTGKVPIPRAIKASHAGGKVEIFFLISRTGAVIDVEPLSAPTPELEELGIQMVKSWSYKPVLRNGRPLEVISVANLDLQF